MRITCPHCGPRTSEEFSYLGDANPVRPDETGLENMKAWHEYVHIRDNPPFEHRELFYHAAGCRAWLVVTRNVTTHEILGVEVAKKQQTG
jgi:heterotetrameric sarcosine oxidase delta subunit